MRVAGSPRSTLARGASLKSGRWPSRVWITSISLLRAPASRALMGATAAPSRDTSLPSDSPKPPGSRKSRCMSMTMSAVRSGLIAIASGSASMMLAMLRSFLDSGPRVALSAFSRISRHRNGVAFRSFFVAVYCVRSQETALSERFE